jgi:hypothetical protein
MTKKAIVKKNFYYKEDSNSMNVICTGTELKHKDGWYVIHNIAIEPTLFPENFIEDTPEYFEIIKEYDHNWRPEYGEAFWFEEIDGNICYDTYTDNSEDNYIIQQHPIFSTKQEARKWQEAKNKLYWLRDRINGDWVPDWDRSDQTKYSLVYNHLEQKVDVKAHIFHEDEKKLLFKENPKIYCEKNGISWGTISEAFKIYIRVE